MIWATWPVLVSYSDTRQSTRHLQANAANITVSWRGNHKEGAGYQKERPEHEPGARLPPLIEVRFLDKVEEKVQEVVTGSRVGMLDRQTQDYWQQLLGIHVLQRLLTSHS